VIETELALDRHAIALCLIQLCTKKKKKKKRERKEKKGREQRGIDGAIGVARVVSFRAFDKFIREIDAIAIEGEKRRRMIREICPESFR